MSELSGKFIYRPAADRDWYCRFTVKGKLCNDPLNTKNKRDAEKLADEKRDELKGKARRRLKLGMTDMTFEDACELFKGHAKTLDEGGLEAQIDWLLTVIPGETLCSAMTKAIVSDVKHARSNTLRRDHTDAKGKIHYRPVRPGTINKTLRLLRRILHYARDERGVMLNPQLKFGDQFLKKAKSTAVQVRKSL
jgi:hypothetical protein